jgi:putative transposase
LLVADFTYVKLLTGTFAYVAFVIDAFAGTIIGWEAVTSKETRFVESDFLAGSSRRTVHALARR